jgi:hypothetical protein
MSDERRGQPGNGPVRSHGWLSSLAVGATCILAACLAFVLSAASFGVLSLPIVLIGLIGGWFGRSRWVRRPAFSAAASVLAMYLILIVTAGWPWGLAHPWDRPRTPVGQPPGPPRRT